MNYEQFEELKRRSSLHINRFTVKKLNQDLIKIHHIDIEWEEEFTNEKLFYLTI